ncbi:hypothetical protein [Dankookia sp. P2]|uniref:hypothetical protein n=1 Tax=Dankookia sp. P2 TaxID=3423955 RepID=UPI003D667240
MPVFNDPLNVSEPFHLTNPANDRCDVRHSTKHRYHQGVGDSFAKRLFDLILGFCGNVTSSTNRKNL